MIDYLQKYQKYKTKYLKLKEIISGGGSTKYVKIVQHVDIPNEDEIYKFINININELNKIPNKDRNIKDYYNYILHLISFLKKQDINLLSYKYYYYDKSTELTELTEIDYNYFIEILFSNIDKDNKIINFINNKNIYYDKLIFDDRLSIAFYTDDDIINTNDITFINIIKLGDRLGNNLFFIIKFLIFIEYLKITMSSIQYVLLICYSAASPINVNFILNIENKYINDVYTDVLQYINKEIIGKFISNNIQLNKNLWGSQVILYITGKDLYRPFIYHYLLKDEYQIYTRNCITSLLENNIITDLRKNKEAKSYKTITIHTRMSDFCSGMTECFDINTYSTEGESYLILDFDYYINALLEILKKEKEIENLQIIIFYRKTPIDIMVVKLLKLYITKKLGISNIITEYDYCSSEKYSELSLIYTSSLSDYIIISNSTFAFWMFYFKMMKNNNDNNNIYFQKYPIYAAGEDNYLQLNIIPKDELILDVLKDKKTYNDINNNYFICSSLQKDFVRTLLCIIMIAYCIETKNESYDKTDVCYKNFDKIIDKIKTDCTGNFSDFLKNIKDFNIKDFETILESLIYKINNDDDGKLLYDFILYKNHIAIIKDSKYYAMKQQFENKYAAINEIMSLNYDAISL